MDAVYVHFFMQKWGEERIFPHPNIYYRTKIKPFLELFSYYHKKRFPFKKKSPASSKKARDRTNLFVIDRTHGDIRMEDHFNDKEEDRYEEDRKERGTHHPPDDGRTNGDTGPGSSAGGPRKGHSTNDR